MPHHTEYDPADYAPGGKYYDGKGTGHGQVVLIDEDNGSIVGELGENAQIVEDSKLHPGNKDPVEIEVSGDGNAINVRPVSEDYLKLAKHPAYQSSTLVGNAATASRLIVTGGSYIGNILTSGADSFTKKTKPIAKPMEFKPATHDRVRKINNFTQGAAGMSAKTVGSITNYAQNLAAGIAGHKKNRPHKGYDEKGNPLSQDDYKPGLLNKSLIAFSTIADGIEYSGKNLLRTSGTAASTMVGHRWGDEAGNIATQLAGGVKNVGLVYIDVTGVSRRAVIKSVAKGMVVGRVRGGGEVVVGGGDGGEVSEDEKRRIEQQQQQNEKSGAPPGGFAPQGGEYGAPPPRYSEAGQEYGSTSRSQSFRKQ